MSLDWAYSGPACDGFHIFVHQPNDAPGTFNDRVSSAGQLAYLGTGIDDPADAWAISITLCPWTAMRTAHAAQHTVNFAAG